MKQFEVTLYFHSNATVTVLAENEQEALDAVREMDISEQIQNGLLEEDHDVTENPYSVPDGVIINNGEMPMEENMWLEEKGYLVLRLGEYIEYEDCETGELKSIRIEKFYGDHMLCDEYAADGKILSEIELPYMTYLYQLKESGALDAYPLVEMN